MKIGHNTAVHQMLDTLPRKINFEIAVPANFINISVDDLAKNLLGVNSGKPVSKIRFDRCKQELHILYVGYIFFDS